MLYISKDPLIKGDVIQTIILLWNKRVSLQNLNNQQMAEYLLEKIQDVNIQPDKKYILYKLIAEWLFGHKNNIFNRYLTTDQANSFIIQKMQQNRRVDIINSLEQLQSENVFNILESRPTIYVDFQQLFNTQSNEHNLQKEIFQCFLNNLDQCQYDLYTMNHRGQFLITNCINNQNMLIENITEENNNIEQFVKDISTNVSDQVNAISINVNFQPVKFPQQLLQLNIRSLLIYNQDNINLCKPEHLVSINLVRCNGIQFGLFTNLRTIFINESNNIQSSDFIQLKQLESVVIQNCQFNDCQDAEQTERLLKALVSCNNLYKMSLRCQQSNNIQLNPQLYPKLQHIYIFAQMHQGSSIKVESSFQNDVTLIETNMEVNFHDGMQQNVLLHVLEY